MKKIVTLAAIAALTTLAACSNEDTVADATAVATDTANDIATDVPTDAATEEAK